MSRPRINIPAQQSYGEAYRDALQAQIELAPELMASERQYRPQQQQLDIDLLRSALYGSGGQPGLLDMYGGAGAGSRAQQVGMGQYSREQAAADKRAQVEGDMALVRQYGAEARELSRQDNPLLEALEADALSNIGGGEASELTTALERSAMQSLDGQSNPLVQALEADALKQLQGGGRLSDNQRREMSQPLLAQYATAGRVMDNAAAQDLFRRTDDVRNQRMNQARAYGSQLAGMQDARRGQAQSIGAQLASLQDQRLNRARAYGTQVAGMRQQYDPFMAILGRQGAGNRIYGQQMGMAGGLNQGPFFNPEAGVNYAGQAYANRVGLAGAQASARGSAMSGLFGGIGSVIGGMASGGTGLFR